MHFSIILILPSLFLSSIGGSEGRIPSYVGTKVFRVNVSSKDDFQFLLNLQNSQDENFDFWNGPSRRGFSDIMDHDHQLQHHLDAHHLQYAVLIPDLGRVMAEQEQERASRLKLKETASLDWTDYHGTQTILDWLETMATTHADLATTQVLGQTTEGREIILLKVSTGGLGKPAIFIEGTLHAREWISPAVTTYIINELLSNRTAHAELLESVDFYFVPLVNVDGYDFTWTTDRLWRKTRSVLNSSDCVGVDANRNFDFHFGDESGASSDPCNLLFHGPAAFSEPETAALRNFFQRNDDVNWVVYISMHSYGQLFLTPWNWSLDAELPEDFPETMELANVAVDAIENTHGRVYEAGSGAEILYLFSGSSADWAKGLGNSKHAFTIELRGGDYGFLLPPSEIIPNCEEIWNAIDVIARRIS